MNEDILLQYIDGTLPASGVTAVEEWLAASPENAKLLEQLYFTHEVVKRIKVMRSVDPDQALQRFKTQVRIVNKKARLHRVMSVLQRTAAILFLPVLILSAYLWMQGDKKDVRMVEVHTNPGVVSAFDLPDGSRVWLNAASSLKYPSEFVADNRQVILEGQGYFDVTHDEKKPFIVQAGAAYAVEVLGTTFNIAAYADEDEIETTLIEGSVKVSIHSPNGQPISRKIKPNEKATFTKTTQQLDVSTVNTDYETAWKDGTLVFRNHPMDEVLKVLSRHYHVKFLVKDSVVLNSIITAKFKEEQLPQVMEYLRLASSIKYKIRKPSATSGQTPDIPIIEISK